MVNEKYLRDSLIKEIKSRKKHAYANKNSPFGEKHAYVSYFGPHWVIPGAILQL
jgi:hypothetical protein